MRMSSMLAPTVKEVPAEAEIPSHRLMIRAGFIRKLASGTYTYLPLGWRTLRKIMAIIRQEMDAAGAQEILMPALQPMELWQRTGRDQAYGETMCRFTDRHGRQNVLAPTAEEVVTALVASEVRSYKQLPLNLYQINVKFRDEFRPRFGVLRSREFHMKDAYSFHASPESLQETYDRMYVAYRRVFQRCGVPFVIVDAESGEMGGTGSQQFTVPCDNGEDYIVTTADGSYAASLEKAPVDPPAPTEAPADRPAMQEVHTPSAGSIEAVCQMLNTRPEQMIKTLIYKTADAVVAVVVRGDHEANVEKVAATTGLGGLELADAGTIREVTGAGVGFAGPMGLADKVTRMLIDHAVAAMARGAAGANRTDYHVLNVVPGRDFPLQGRNVTVGDVRLATPGDTWQGRKLLFARGIEVGQLFKLGTKYSQALGAKFLDEAGKEKVALMGCYGIGVNRIFASAVETGNDANGCILPINIAPFEVQVLVVGGDNPQVAQAAGQVYDELLAGGVDVVLDDRDLRPGVKFKDADLIGIPVRVVVGERNLKAGQVEIKRRTDTQAALVPLDRAVAEVRSIVDEMKARLDGDA